MMENVTQIVINTIEHMPPGIVGKEGFFLYLSVTGAAKMSYAWNLFWAQVVNERLLPARCSSY